MPKPSCDSLVLSIGGISVFIFSESQEFMAQTEERYANFINSKMAPSLRIGVNISSEKMESNLAPSTERPEVVFDNGTERWSIAWQDLSGEFDLVNGEGRMSCTLNPAGLNSFLRFVYSLVLLKEMGFLIHASGLIKNGRGYIFPGKSGAGKTTIIQLSPGAALLSDDLVLVKVRDTPVAFGTPFWGGLAVAGENTSGALTGIYFPSKDKENYTKKLKPSEALEKLLINVVFFARNEEFSKQLFNLCFDLVNKVPAYELHFLPDPSFWRSIDAG